MTASPQFMQKTDPVPAATAWLTGAKGDVAQDWLRALRATGAEAFAARGLPQPADEGWQYLNLRGLVAGDYQYHEAPVKFDAQKLPAPLLADSYRVVLVNGQLQLGACRLPSGVALVSLKDAAQDDVENYLSAVGDMMDAPFKALNAAYARDGFVLSVPRGQEVDKPVEVLFLNTDGAASYPRALYRADENAGLTVIERHTGAGRYFANLYAVAALAPAARMKIYRFVTESPDATHVSQLVTHQQKNSVFEGFSGAFSGGLVRQQAQLQLLDSGISSTMSGIYLLRDRQQHDYTILADHFEPDGQSVQHFKGVIDDQARAVFQGKIQVRRPAQKTDGYQSHHALLLTELAEANARPELEIYADDVKCSHGATAGMLDREALFYLRSRGIPLAEARGLLIKSFIADAIERLSFAPVRDIYQSMTENWLEARK